MGLCSSCCSAKEPGVDGAEDIAAITMAPVQAAESESQAVSPETQPIMLPGQGEHTPSSEMAPPPPIPVPPAVEEKEASPAEAPVPPPPTLTPEPSAPTKKGSSSSSDGRSPRRVPTPAYPVVQPTRTGEEGWYLLFSHSGQGTLQGRYCQKPPAGHVLISRPDVPFDEGLYFQSPVELGKNMKAEWMLQAKATCQWIRTAAQHKGEIEVKPDYFEALPRKSMIVFHHEDGKITTLRTPVAFDTAERPVDAVCVLPLGADVYKGFTSMKTHVFLEKGVRKGATLKLGGP
eukprot:Gregarina_sp_Poly_1__11374@NODE_962_length_5540_cov_79_200621_g682_i0_p3_GENE_NODE_962_length_5540_cov_79_200621_g682_i0NODE_962_length_5540_cov_79_200621_g682_i0_p3_ORF_typecomplete_len289_score49_87IMP2_C/PF18591_1/9_7e03IMP2_C/PF18591_1/0_00012IMP2_N/PF18590_1/0_00017CBP_BcsO/PF17037_5/7_5_NODE_962_length_5540_cov_79_200621_g682_i027133579